MADLMRFLTKGKRTSKYYNMRKRVYDVVNIFIALKIVSKVKSLFLVSQKDLERGPRKIGGDGLKKKKTKSIAFVPREKFLNKLEELVS